MKKEKFNSLNFEDKISYINAQLMEGQTVSKIREEIGVGEKSLQKEIKLNGYKYDNKLKQYIINTESNTNMNDIVVLAKNNSQILKESQRRAISFLEENFEILELLVEKFKANTTSNTTSNTNKNQIIIDLIDDKHLNPKAKAFRVNMFVYKEWQEFCEKQRYSKQDLLSMAMKEYMDKYK